MGMRKILKRMKSQLHNKASKDAKGESKAEGARVFLPREALAIPGVAAPHTTDLVLCGATTPGTLIRIVSMLTKMVK